jgi:hypothetical protein
MCLRLISGFMLGVTIILAIAEVILYSCRRRRGCVLVLELSPAAAASSLRRIFYDSVGDLGLLVLCCSHVGLGQGVSLTQLDCMRGRHQCPMNGDAGAATTWPDADGPAHSS